jgi:hypothetical protein
VNAYNEDFRFEDGVLHVRLTGGFPNELLNKEQNLFQPLIDACLTYKCSKAMIDATDLEVDLGTMGLFRAGEDVASLTSFKIRIVIIAREDMLDSFFENVSKNRGGNVRVFTNVDAARAWLNA